MIYTLTGTTFKDENDELFKRSQLKDVLVVGDVLLEGTLQKTVSEIESYDDGSKAIIYSVIEV